LSKIFSFIDKTSGLKYQSRGFKFRQLGPEKLASKGFETMEQMKERAI